VWALGRVGKDTPAGRRARAMGGVWVRVGGVGWGLVGWRLLGGLIGLNSPVYLMTLDRLTERS
jgi:hypothetical protein